MKRFFLKNRMQYIFRIFLSPLIVHFFIHFIFILLTKTFSYNPVFSAKVFLLKIVKYSHFSDGLITLPLLTPFLLQQEKILFISAPVPLIIIFLSISLIRNTRTYCYGILNLRPLYGSLPLLQG